MIKIVMPNNNIEERDYILNIIFNEFLELEYQVKVENEKIEENWKIELENGSELILEDHFFSQYPKDLEYLKLEHIPAIVNFSKNRFTVEDDIPILYGIDKFDIVDTGRKQKSIRCGIDIFASSFFMLTRWEEYVNQKRDTHNRFSALESLAFKESFLDRPIVNEYLEMLWNMLIFLGFEQHRKIKEYQLYLTHDVDAIQRYPSFRKVVKSLIREYSISSFFIGLGSLLRLRKDPFDTFDYLMSVSEQVGVKSYFFFMGEGNTKYDNIYKIDSNVINRLITKIKKRGHKIGIHPTYDAYNDSKQIKKEKKELESNLNIEIKYGREHYLRFEVPVTWQAWEDNHMEWDSTLGYADREGFRCGVCYEYSVFNILTRKKLNLKEKPLIVMDGAFVEYQKDLSPDAVEKRIKLLIDRIKKYDGEFVFLWHNSSFNTNEWNAYEHIYQKVLA